MKARNRFLLLSRKNAQLRRRMTVMRQRGVTRRLRLFDMQRHLTAFNIMLAVRKKKRRTIQRVSKAQIGQIQKRRRRQNRRRIVKI